MVLNVQPHPFSSLDSILARLTGNVPMFPIYTRHDAYVGDTQHDPYRPNSGAFAA